VGLVNDSMLDSDIYTGLNHISFYSWSTYGNNPAVYASSNNGTAFSEDRINNMVDYGIIIHGIRYGTKDFTCFIEMGYC